MRREDSLKDSQTNSKKKLTPLQFHVTQQCGTEPPFQNEYWNEHRKGIYVDITTGQAQSWGRGSSVSEFSQAPSLRCTDSASVGGQDR